MNMMKRVNAGEQTWAMTCGANTAADFIDGFYTYRDQQSIDAPMFIPAGCMRGADGEFGSYVVGGLFIRSGSSY